MRKNAEDYLFSQIADVVSLSRGVKNENHWLKPDVYEKWKRKLEWLLSESFGYKIEILTDSTSPETYYDLSVDGDKYRITSVFCLIDVQGGELDSELFDFLTNKFYRITPDNLEGYDDVYQEFIRDRIV